MFDFSKVVAAAATKGEAGLRRKKDNQAFFKANVSNKLEHIFNISKNLQSDIKAFYESPRFLIGNEPSLSADLEVYRIELELI